VFAVTTGFQILAFLVVRPEQIGFDARLYAAAARAWLEGADPWQVSAAGIYFAAPPPSLLLFAPFAWLPPAATTVVWVGGSACLAVLAIRALGMPLWWLAWWPIVDGCLIGSLSIAALAALVLARGRFGGIAPIAKIYAFAPMIGERRFRQVIMAAVAILVTAPFLPWVQYIRELPGITANLAQTSATTSVFGQPLLMIAGAVALLATGIVRAGWLCIPVLWPYTQPHYLTQSVPAMSPWLTVAWCFPHPLVVVSSTVVEAVALRIRSPHWSFRRAVQV